MPHTTHHPWQELRLSQEDIRGALSGPVLGLWGNTTQLQAPALPVTVKYPLCFSGCGTDLATQCMVPQTAAAALSGSLLEMQDLGPHPRLPRRLTYTFNVSSLGIEYDLGHYT